MTKSRRRKQSRRLPVTIVPRENWGIALEIGGVVQSVSVPDDLPDIRDDEPHPGPGRGYWGLLLPPGCPKRALLLGLGGGTVARLLAKRCPESEITGIEREAGVIALARTEFALDDVPRLAIIETDAFAWVAAQSGAQAGRYDLVCMDLFEAGRLAQGALATAFLRQVAALLAPDGTFTINLMVTARTEDQIHRLRRVFTITRDLRLRGNRILHAVPLPPGRSADALDG